MTNWSEDDLRAKGFCKDGSRVPAPPGKEGTAGSPAGGVGERPPPAGVNWVYFTVPGIPVAKGRARTGLDGRHYTPAKTRSYENLIAMAAQHAMAGRTPFSQNIPLSALIVAMLPIPASWSGKRRIAALDQRVLPTKRPDLDNFCKAAFDGCNGIVFADDSSVVRLEIRKEYGHVPGLTVQIIPLTTVDGG